MLDGGGEGQSDEGRDAAAQLGDGGIRGQQGAERVGGGGYPLREEGGDLPEDYEVK